MVSLNIEVKTMKNNYQLPILIENDEDGFYVVECPVFSGCYNSRQNYG